MEDLEIYRAMLYSPEPWRTVTSLTKDVLPPLSATWFLRYYFVHCTIGSIFLYFYRYIFSFLYYYILLMFYIHSDNLY